MAQSVPALDHAAEWQAFCDDFELEPVVYFIGAPNGLVKIGFATDLDVRFGELLASPVPLSILAFTAGGRAIEQEYHRRFGQWRRHGEWFEMSPEIDAEIKRLNIRPLPDPPNGG